MSKQNWTGGQYSLVRFTFGVYLAFFFASLLPFAQELFSWSGVLSKSEFSSYFKFFPNILSLNDHPVYLQLFLGSAVLSAMFFAVGYHVPFSSIWLWYVLACLLGRNPLIYNVSFPFIGWLLLANLLIPSNPYGSVQSRGRIDPKGNWQMPDFFPIAIWVVGALAFSYSGYAKFQSPSWKDGSALIYILQNPLAQDSSFKAWVLELPTIILRSLTWMVLYFELLFAPISMGAFFRPVLWGGAVLIQIILLFLMNTPFLNFGMLCFLFFMFDPNWLQFKRSEITSGKDVIFYDGNCGLCHGFVRFSLAEDINDQFLFSPLHSHFFNREVPSELRKNIPDSVVVWTAGKKRLIKSDAVIYVFRRLGGIWRVLAAIFDIFPGFIRNLGYDFVAKIRHSIFPKPKEVCPLMPSQMRDRFKL